MANIWEGGKGHFVTKEQMGLPAAIAISDVFYGPDGMLRMSALGSEDDEFPNYMLRLDTEKHKVVSKKNGRVNPARALLQQRKPFGINSR
ncbi:hypothetical protein [Acanthopleuribacter pedis]|uniref:Uncharacterized protein n=1 Tax=Acanthopleuribacter pedis TaxID=442870 RepID=A0A8J7U4G7_9BACT|nr:hypothetical protein [Acanthopleuribacter pedis]MBO1319784.1 hypothetical protein [Acanthopleuribacter pedis]